MARLEKEGGCRLLYCQLCGSAWRYMRVKCPFCCSEDQKKLKFKAEEKSPYRIDLCEQCGRYIKTIDERRTGGDRGEIIPTAEDLASFYLDIVAENEGYVRSWFFPPAANEPHAREETTTVQ
jgi:FdhE protein